MNVEDIISLKENNSLEIKELYETHHSSFFGFGKKYGISKEELADIYQESFLALRKHAISGKLDRINCSIKTYLFGIGKYLIFDELKRKKKFVPLLHNLEGDVDVIAVITRPNEEPLTLEQRLLRDNFKKLGKKCQHMLTLFFYRGLSNEEIFQKEGYENEAVVRSQKSRCLKSLKDFINKNE